MSETDYEVDALSPDRVASTEQLRELNAIAGEHGHFAALPEAINDLDPAAGHLGTPFLVDEGVSRRHGRRILRGNAWLGVVWLVRRRGGETRLVAIGCRVAAFYELAQEILLPSARRPLLAYGKAFAEQMVAEGRTLPAVDGGTRPLEYPVPAERELPPLRVGLAFMPSPACAVCGEACAHEDDETGQPWPGAFDASSDTEYSAPAPICDACVELYYPARVAEIERARLEYWIG